VSVDYLMFDILLAASESEMYRFRFTTAAMVVVRSVARLAAHVAHTMAAAATVATVTKVIGRTCTSRGRFDLPPMNVAALHSIHHGKVVAVEDNSLTPAGQPDRRHKLAITVSHIQL
jgi:hypothetical protein